MRRTHGLMSLLFVTALAGCGSGTQSSGGSGGDAIGSGGSVGGNGGGGAPGSGGGAVGSGGAIPEPPAGSPVALHGQLHVCGTKICDKNNSPVQLKGVSSFWLAWATGARAYAEDLDGLKWMRDNWKLSVIRAAVGVEGNSNYLNSPSTGLPLATTIVDNAIQAGVYVIVDWHTLETHQAEAIEFFQFMTKRYAAYPNVLWEDYNEPTRVDWSSQLKPYHQAVVTAIRAKDPDNIIILGTPNWSQYVDRAANDPLTGTNLLYTLHFYSCDMGAQLRATADAAIAKGIGLFVTEWGATKADGGTNGQVCLGEAANWTAWMAQNGIGWTVWRLDNCAGATMEATCLLKGNAPLPGPYTGFLSDEGTFVAQELQK